ncbi:nucleoside-diphosphate kinase [Alphaproteobacteria bacterium]
MTKRTLSVISTILLLSFVAYVTSGATVSNAQSTACNNMAERTLSIIKPDATKRNITGLISAEFEAAGLRIVAQKKVWLTRKQAEDFYAVHRERPFYRSLAESMISGPIMVQVLEGENAVVKSRDVIGATNPVDAAPGTIRKKYAESIEANSVHGSDSVESAKKEIAFFFSDFEIVG